MDVSISLALLGYYFFMLFLLTAMGVGIASFLMNERNKEYVLLVSPFLGLSFLVIIQEFLNALSIYGDVNFIVTIFILIVINFITLKKRRLELLNKKSLLLMMVIIFSFLASLPILQNGELQSYGSNGDIVSYATMVDHISEYGTTMPETGDYTPGNNLIANLFRLNVRLGSMNIQAFFDNAFGLDAYQSFTIMGCFFYGLTILSAVVFAILVFGMEYRNIAFVAILTALNSLIIWSNYGGFQSQAMVMPLLLMIIAFYHEGAIWKSYKDLTICTFLIAGTISIYPEILVYVFVSLSIYAFSLYLKKEINGRSVVLSIIFLGVGSIIVNPIACYKFGKVIILHYMSASEFNSSQNRMLSGNIRYFISAIEYLGLAPHLQGSNIVEYIPKQIAFGLRCVFILSWLPIILYIKKLNNKALLLGSMLISVVLGGVVNYWLRFPYGYFKNASVAALFIVVSVSIAYSIVLKEIKSKYLSNFMSAIMIIIIAFASNSIVITVLLESRYTIEDDVKEFAKVSEFVDSNDMIYVKGYSPSIEQMWINYFLVKSNVAWDQSIGYYGGIDQYKPDKLPDIIVDRKDNAGLSIWDRNIYDRKLVLNELVVYSKKESIVDSVDLDSGQFVKFSNGDTLVIDMRLSSIKINGREIQVDSSLFEGKRKPLIPYIGHTAGVIIAESSELGTDSGVLIMNVDRDTYRLESLTDQDIYLKNIIFTK